MRYPGCRGVVPAPEGSAIATTAGEAADPDARSHPRRPRASRRWGRLALVGSTLAVGAAVSIATAVTFPDLILYAVAGSLAIVVVAVVQGRGPGATSRGGGSASGPSPAR